MNTTIDKSSHEKRKDKVHLFLTLTWFWLTVAAVIIAFALAKPDLSILDCGCLILIGIAAGFVAFLLFTALLLLIVKTVICVHQTIEVLSPCVKWIASFLIKRLNKPM